MGVSVDIVVDYIHINQCMETTADIITDIPHGAATVLSFVPYSAPVM